MRLREWFNINKGVFKERDSNFLMNVFMNKRSVILPDDYILNSYDLRYLTGVKSLYSKGWPIAYILRKEQFFGFDFFVEPGVLIPRPETEIITEEALNIVNNNRAINSVLDLCCGTSCIAIVIAKHADRYLNIFASDINTRALMVSRKNIDFYKAPIQLIRSDLFSGFKKKAFDLIVTNPPYVETNNIKGSLSFEPEDALDGKEDGFYFIKNILMHASEYLRCNGYLIIEIGYNHYDLLDKFLKELGVYDIIKWIKDYSSYTRGVVLKRR